MTTTTNNNGTYTVYSETNNEYYTCDATTEQEAIDSYNAYRSAIPLQSAKQTKLQELQGYIETTIANGLVIDNITYPVHDSAITNMNVLLNTFNTEVNLNTYVGADTKYLIDNDYQTQQVTKNNYRSAILQCINFREQLHFLKASKTAEINACISVAEVEAVTW